MDQATPELSATRGFLVECADEWTPALVPLASSVLFAQARVLTTHAFDTKQGAHGKWIPISAPVAATRAATGITRERPDGTIDILEPWAPQTAPSATTVAASPTSTQHTQSEAGFDAAMRRLDRLIEQEAESSKTSPIAAARAQPTQLPTAVFARRDRLTRPEAVSGRPLMAGRVVERAAPRLPSQAVFGGQSASTPMPGAASGAEQRNMSRFRQQRQEARSQHRG